MAGLNDIIFYLVFLARGQRACPSPGSAEPAPSGPLRQAPMSTEVVIFACQQAVPNPESLRAQWGKGQTRLRVLSEPCSSKVEAFQMLRTLATPWTWSGSSAALKTSAATRRAAIAWGRVKYAQRYLEEIGLEAGRLGHSLVHPGDDKLGRSGDRDQGQDKVSGTQPVEKRKG